MPDFLTPAFRYYLAFSLSVGFVLLSLLEAWLYGSMENELAVQRDHQSKAAYAAQIDFQTDRILHRATFEALHDAGLVEILKEQGIRIKPTNVPEDSETSPTNSFQPATNPAPTILNP